MLQALESAAFSAWPSRHCEDVQGWLLRLDRGYTKRANSVNATVNSQALTGHEVESLEKRFRDSGLAPIFRLTSFAAMDETDRMLESRGYHACDASLVMTRSLESPQGTSPYCAPDAITWLDAFRRASDQRDADQSLHLEILQRIATPCAWATHSESEPDLSCGLGVLVDDKLGLFDIVTRRDHQRRGLARQLCSSLLAWGAQNGAKTAFLQVLVSNTAAVRLYQQLGFEIAYRYWYRVTEA